MIVRLLQQSDSSFASPRSSWLYHGRVVMVRDPLVSRYYDGSFCPCTRRQSGVSKLSQSHGSSRRFGWASLTTGCCGLTWQGGCRRDTHSHLHGRDVSHVCRINCCLLDLHLRYLPDVLQPSGEWQTTHLHVTLVCCRICYRPCRVQHGVVLHWVCILSTSKPALVLGFSDSHLR